MALFCAGVILMSVAVGIQESIFNNYLDDIFKISASARGQLEFPRELPGLLVVLMAGALYALAVTHLGVISAVVFAAGMVGLAYWYDNFWAMVLMMMVASAGVHLLMPVTSTIALSVSEEHRRGRSVAQLGVIGTVGTLIGTGLVRLLSQPEDPRYRMLFIIAAVFGALTGVVYWKMHLPHLHQRRAKLVYRRKFNLYYLLEFLFGARKQIFLTFGFWVLVQVYDAPAAQVAGLLFTASLVGLLFRPLVGTAIDHLGERTVMVADGVMLAAVCLGYGYAERIAPTPSGAYWIAATCFIADNLLFTLGMARSVYVARLTETPQELTSTLSMGVSINHIASMTIPAIAGALWVAMGYELVFLAAAFLALSISAVSLWVPRHARAVAAETTRA